MWLLFCFRCETTVAQFEPSAGLAGTQCENNRLFFQWRASLVGSTFPSFSQFLRHTHYSCYTFSYILNKNAREEKCDKEEKPLLRQTKTAMVPPEELIWIPVQHECMGRLLSFHLFEIRQ